MGYIQVVKIISQRELHDDIARVLRDVEAGERLRVTVGGRPVADLVPVSDHRRTFVSREEVSRILEFAPLDENFARDVRSAAESTIDEIE